MKIAPRDSRSETSLKWTGNSEMITAPVSAMQFAMILKRIDQ
jgi:hypothetical protein